MNRQQRTQEKHKAEAKAVGLTLIGPGKEAHYRIYQFRKCKHEQEIALNAVRRDVFTCRQCLADELKAGAKAAGLILIGPGRTSHLRTYRFKKCKHEQQIRPVEIRRNKFHCSQCFDKKILSEAKAAGLTLIGPGRNHLHRTYRFNKCKHEQEITLGSVRHNTFQCRKCLDNELQTEAKAVGLTLIGPGRNHQFRMYRFDQCKHKQDFRTGEIRRNSFRCDQCLQKKLQTEAKAVGLTMTGPGNNIKNRTYRFNKCRHEQELGVSNVRANYFICHTCEETSRDLPSNLYLLKIQVGSMKWVKLGYAKTVEERAKTYGLPAEAEIMQVNILPFDSGRAAHEAEASLHKKYRAKRLSSRKMKKYHTVSGYRECYPIDLMGKLSKEMKKLSPL